MQYLLMIYCDEASDAKRPKEELEAEMGAYWAFTEEVQKSGAHRAGEALHPSSTATTVKVRNGKTITTDGPFAETKEQLGGYYVVEANNLDEAIQWAVKIPHVNIGAIEVRPIVDFSKEASASGA